MFTEDQLLPISALQHLIFCERQCALIHVERLWAENRWTAEGRVIHNKTHTTQAQTLDGVRITRSLWLKSTRLGLVGQADVVEFHSDGRVIPVEYKRGQPKKDDSDRVQICAQALCLEEMLDVEIKNGFLFYGKRKRRTPVKIDQGLRQRTQEVILRLREMIDHRETPTAVRQPKCDSCSLVELCLPDSMRWKSGVTKFIDRQFESVLSANGPATDEWEP